jgi:osmotically-inducible protein OsmY
MQRDARAPSVERNVMKTDAQLKRDVENELEWDPAVDARHVGVAVNEGVVLVTGHLTTFAEKQAIEQAVQRVSGVRALAVDLEVRLEPRHRRYDTEIAAAVGSAFKWHAQIPDDRIHVKVERGWVTLTGEVDWDYQRHNAELVVRPLTGVVGVINDITLRRREAPEGIAERIHDALIRCAEDDARHIEVQVRDATATLRGNVNSWPERSAAQAAAWAAPGVSRVVNEIKVLS